MSPSPKKTTRVDAQANNSLMTRERGERRLRKATTLTIAGALTITAVTAALASNVPMGHAHATGSSSIASSPAAIAAAQQAAALASASTGGNANNYGAAASTPTYSQSAPVASSGGS